MNEMAQTMREIPVEIVRGFDGDAHACLFLHQAGPRGRERILERLNDPDRFLPVRGGDGRVRLLSKTAISVVRCLDEPEEAAELRELQARPARVAVRLREGSEMLGDLLLLLPGDRARVLDFLNQPDRFFLLATPRGACFVNKEQVEHVAPRDPV